MKVFFNVLHKIGEIGSLISLLGMISVVLLQVFARFFLPSAPSWTEELARMFFIYMVTFGAGVALRDDEYVKIDLLKNYLHPSWAKKISVLVYLIIMIFFGIATYYSIDFAKLGIHERSPGLSITMTFVFLSMILMMGSLCIFALEKISTLLNSSNPDSQ